MMRIIQTPLILLFCVAFLVYDSVAAEISVVQVESIVLPQPNDVLQKRLSGAAELAQYIEKIAAALTTALESAGELKPTSGAMVVAVKPQYKAKFWLMSSEYPFQRSVSEDLQGLFDKIRPVTVQEGPIAFALLFAVNGGGKPIVERDSPMPIPTEWQEAAKKASGPLLVPDGFVALVWPDPVGGPKVLLTVPDGFELQSLDVTQGSLIKPRGWFYTFKTTEQSLVWTVSKENPHPDGYKTGMRIQLLPGVSKLIGKSPESLAESIAGSVKASKPVISLCPKEQAGIFSRICIETKETIEVGGKSGVYHIAYTISWTNEKDMVAVMIFGTPYDEWQSYKETFARMRNVVLIGETFTGGNK